MYFLPVTAFASAACLLDDRRHEAAYKSSNCTQEHHRLIYQLHNTIEGKPSKISEANTNTHANVRVNSLH